MRTAVGYGIKNKEITMMIPYVAFGNEQIEKMKKVGAEAKCPHCRQKHRVQYGTDQEGNRSTVLGFVKCSKNGASYLVAIEGKEIL